MQGKKVIAWHNLVVEINVYISCMAYTRISILPLYGRPIGLWRSGRFSRRKLAVTLEILSCADVAVLRHALLEPSHLFEHRVQHPPHVHRLLPEIEAFSGITFQVKHHGELHVRDGLTDAVGLAENDFEVLPLHRHQSAVKAEIEDRLSSGGVPLAQQIV